MEAREEVEQSAENIFPAENEKLPWFDAAHHGMLGDGSNFTIDMESVVVEALGKPNMSPQTTFSVGYEAETVRVTVTYGREQYMDVEQGLGDAAYENNSPSFVESLYHVEEEKSVE